MENTWREWIKRLCRRQSRFSQKSDRRVRLNLALLEDRTTPANLTISNISFVNASDQSETPTLGQELYVQANFTTQNLPSNARYRLSFDVNGTTLDTSYMTWGAGTAGTSSWYIYWGYWLPIPGSNKVTVTVDPDHSVAESTYADNTATSTFAPQISTSTNAGYTVSQIRDAYGINSIPNFGSKAADGSGQTIAIVDNYNDPDILSDLNGFDNAMTLTSTSTETLYQQYGAASSILSVFNQSGTNITSSIAKSGVGAVPPVDPVPIADAQPETEISLDVEWAHAIAPGAKIDLIEGDGTLDDLLAGAKTAGSLPGVTVVSMSWGLFESDLGSSGEKSVDSSTFSVPGVTFIAASNDYGSPGTYPAYSPNVVAVGGTTLDLNGDTYDGETGWSFPTPTATLAHNSSSYSQTGTWTSNAGGFSGTYGTAAGGSASNATWTTKITAADDGPSDGIADGIEVSATWVANPSNATNATYQIYDGSAKTGKLLGTVHINQTQAPVGTADGSSEFQNLGVFYPTSGTLTVVLNAGESNGRVVADAVALAPAWASSGGPSQYEAEPAYQLPYQSTGYRTTPDVSFDGDPNTGVWAYDSYNYPSDPLGQPYGGTSLGSPVWAGLIAIANQGRVASGEPVFNSGKNPQQILTALYSLPSSDYRDVTTGYNGYSAGTGYDFVTGLGTPIVNELIPALVSYGAFPSISGIDPSVGLTEGGEKITISGTNFTGTQAVDFGAVPASSFTVVSNTEILAVVPANSAGTVNVSIIGSKGKSPTTSTDQFVYSSSDVDPATSPISLSSYSVESSRTITVTLQAQDVYGNNLATGGLTVTFALGSDTGGSGTFSSVTDNNNGTYTATFTGTLAGNNTITAAIDGSPVTSGSPYVGVTPGPVNLTKSFVSLSASSVRDDGRIQVTLQAVDSYGNLETTGGLIVSFFLVNPKGGRGTFSTAVDNGNGTYTATFTATAVGSNFISAMIDASAIKSASKAIKVIL